MYILALNVGSSTIKYKLFKFEPADRNPEGAAPKVLAEGAAEHGGALAPGSEQPAGASEPSAGGSPAPMERAVQDILSSLHGQTVDAVGHRVVHGGPLYSAPTPITPAVMEGLRALRDLNPLHNPLEIALMEGCQRLLPGVPEVAVFDTAFHETMPEEARTYALPHNLSQRFGLRRHGFHGISHRYVSGKLLKLMGRPPEGTRLVILHLGSGASACAVRDGRSVDTSMGLTPLEGLVMASRSGDIDPGLLLYLSRTAGMSFQELDNLLNHESGLKGVSGVSSDLREIETAAAAGDSQAKLAIELFAYRARKYIGAYAAAMGGLDAVAFTGGIGEHSAEMREHVLTDLEFLGLVLDPERNRNCPGAGLITTDASRTPAHVVPTDEEQQLAQETWDLLTRPSG